MENSAKGNITVLENVIGFVGIIVSVISIIVTLISINQTKNIKKHQKSNPPD